MTSKPIQAPSMMKTEAPAAAQQGRGRPAIITLPVVADIARLIAKGMSEEQACFRMGINHASFRTARHRNPEFETAIKEAQADYLDESLDIIGKGGRGWQGRAWILERRHGDQFRRNSALELSGHFAACSPADLLFRKPLQHWTVSDLEQSVGAWKLLKKWPNEQLGELLTLYKRCWAPPAEWTDEQLEWGSEIEKALTQRVDEREVADCRAMPLLLTDTLSENSSASPSVPRSVRLPSERRMKNPVKSQRIALNVQVAFTTWNHGQHPLAKAVPDPAK